MFTYDFDGLYHFNYVRLQLKSCKNRSLIIKPVVLPDNVLKEIASFCNPYVLKKMITAFTGVDISYELEPSHKTAPLLLKGTDWKERNLCKEKQDLFDHQCLNHMTNCVGRLCTIDGTDYDRYGIGIVGKPCLFMNTSVVTFNCNNLRRHISWKDILLIDCGNKTSDTDEAILPSIYTPKKMTSIKSKMAKVTQHISRRTLRSCRDSKAVKKKVT